MKRLWRKDGSPKHGEQVRGASFRHIHEGSLSKTKRNLRKYRPSYLKNLKEEDWIERGSNL